MPGFNRYGGVVYSPPLSWRSKSYLEGKTIDGTNTANDTKYNDFFPQCYGTTFVDAPVLNVIGDANATRFEVALCVGQVGTALNSSAGVLLVLVNDTEIPFSNPRDGLFTWTWTTLGGRNGRRNTDPGYTDTSHVPLGDPYGSIAVLSIAVPRKMQDSNSIPKVRCLIQGPQVRVYSDATTYTYQRSSNPVWVLLDVLTWANFKYSQINMASFVAAAAICSQSVSYTKFDGTTGSHARYDCSLTLRERKSTADIVQGLLRSFNGYLLPNDNGGLGLYVRGTLASQQPSAVAGSNYNIAVTSKLLNGTTASGYVAYKFDSSNILQQNGIDQIQFLGGTIAQSPNRISFQFQDIENRNQYDALAQVEPLDIKRAQQEVGQELKVYGINNYDQARRISATFLAETHRGNEYGDTRGTRTLQIKTTSKAVDLRVGHLILVNYPRLGIIDQLCRVAKVQCSNNADEWTITARYHSDDWYTDAYGQGLAPGFSAVRRDKLKAPPVGWSPYQIQPPVNDSIQARNEWTYDLSQSYTTAADGTAIPRLTIKGKIPTNQFSSEVRPPFVPAQGTTSPTGGTIPGGGYEYVVAIAAKDSAGKLSALSETCSFIITVGGSTNTITVPNIVWQPNGSGTNPPGYSVFAAVKGEALTWQQDGTGNPTSVTLTAIAKSNYSPPDANVDGFVIRLKRASHLGVFGAIPLEIGTNTIKFSNATFDVDQFQNYDISLIAKGDGSTLPVANFKVTSNTSDTLTVTPDPDVAGITNTDILVMCSRPTAGSDGTGKYIVDANWANSLANPTGLAPHAEKGKLLRFIAGRARGEVYTIADNTETKIYIEGNWQNVDYPPDNTSRYVIEEPAWEQETTTSNFTNDDPAKAGSWDMDVNNYKLQQILTQVFTRNYDGYESLDRNSPVRVTYILGSAGSVIGASTLLAYPAGLVQAD